MEWKNIYRGILMGISDLIPGVSGSTIAVILGIYDRFLASINGLLNPKTWRKSLQFLIPLGIGIGITLLVFSNVIHYLLETYPQPMQFFFLGLIIPIIPMLLRRAKAATTFQINHWSLLVIAAIIVAAMAFIRPNEGLTITNITVGTGLFLFFSGWLASMAMLLPGISGSFVLVLIGTYSVALEALSSFNLPIIALIGSGVVVGFLVSSRGISWLLVNYHTATFAVIVGLVIGSLFVIFPGIPTTVPLIVASICTFILGFAVVTLIDRKETKDHERKIKAS